MRAQRKKNELIREGKFLNDPHKRIHHGIGFDTKAGPEWRYRSSAQMASWEQ
jgi:hypothetical protein